MKKYIVFGVLVFLTNALFIFFEMRFLSRGLGLLVEGVIIWGSLLGLASATLMGIMKRLNLINVEWRKVLVTGYYSSILTLSYYVGVISFLLFYNIDL